MKVDALNVIVTCTRNKQLGWLEFNFCRARYSLFVPKVPLKFVKQFYFIYEVKDILLRGIDEMQES